MFLYHIVNVKPSKLRYNDMCLNHLAIRILVMADGRELLILLGAFWDSWGGCSMVEKFRNPVEFQCLSKGRGFIDYDFELTSIHFCWVF